MPKRQKSSLFQTQLLAVSGMSQQACRGEKRKLQLKKRGGRQDGRGHSSLHRMTSLSFYYLSFTLSGQPTSTHLKALQLKQHSQESLSTTEHRGAVTPQLHFILHTDKTCTSHSISPKTKKAGESNLSHLRFIYDLAVFTDPPSSPSTVSPPLGYQMCLARFGMRQTQINILPRGAAVESPR